MTLRPWPLRVSLLVAAGMAAATLLRSVQAGRMATGAAAAALLTGAGVAFYSARTWGLVLMLAAATAFPAAAALGMAPDWFYAVGLAGSLPFALTLRPLARFDPGSTLVFALLASAIGVASSLAWRQLYPFLSTLGIR